MGGIAPKGALATASYIGQYRDTPQRVLQRWNGSAWLPAFPAPVFAESLDAGWTTSGTYTETLTDSSVAKVELTFNAPTSGVVLLTFGARTSVIDNTTVVGFTSVRVMQGSTVVWAPDDERTACSKGELWSSVSTTTRLANLTGDAPYTVTVMHRSSLAGVKTWFDNIFLRVDPMI